MSASIYKTYTDDNHSRPFKKPEPVWDWSVLDDKSVQNIPDEKAYISDPKGQPVQKFWMLDHRKKKGNSRSSFA